MSKRSIYILGAVALLILIFVGAGALFLLPMLTSANSDQSTQATSATPTVDASATPARQANALAKLLRQYSPAMKEQIAQGLHMTPDQLTAQLRAGKTLDQIAAAQGTSTSQLQTIETSAIQSALQPAVDSGDLTAQQVTKIAKRLVNNPQSLDHLLAARTKQTTPTIPAQPTATATTSS